MVAAGLAGDRTVERPGGLETIDALEQRRRTGQRDGELGDVAGLMERVDRRVEQRERVLGIGVDELQARRVASDETFEEMDAMLLDIGETLPPGLERVGGIRFRKCGPVAPKRVGDDPGVSRITGRGDRLLGEVDRLLDPSCRLQAVDERREAERSSGPR